MSIESKNAAARETWSEEYLRTAIELPLLSRPTRERAATASARLAPLVARLNATEGRYDDGGDPTGLDEAAATAGELSLHPEWRYLAPDQRSRLAGRLANLLREQYERGINGAQLDKALLAAQEATVAAEEATKCRGGTADARSALADLAGASVAELAGPEALPDQDLEELRQQGASLLTEALRCLGRQLLGAFERDGSRHLVDGAIDALEHAISAARQAGVEVAPRIQLETQSARLLRFKRFGDPADIEHAVAALQTVWNSYDRAAAESAHTAAAIADGLACMLLARADLPGHKSDIGEAVSMGEEAVFRNPQSPWVAANLAMALLSRYQEAGIISDARRADKLLTNALAALPREAPDRARIQQAHLACRRELASWDTGAVSVSAATASPTALLDEARALLAATPAAARARPARLGALAGTLLNDAEERLDLDPLEESVLTWRSALEAAPPNSFDRPELLVGLAKSLHLRYCLLGDPKDLDVAHRSAAAAADTAPPVELASCLRVLAIIETVRAARGAASAENVTSAFRRALQAAADDPPTLVGVGFDWWAWAAETGRWGEAAEASSTAANSLNRLDRSQLSRQDRETVLRAAPALAAHAAAASVRIDDVEAALTTLEDARLRLISQGLQQIDNHPQTADPAPLHGPPGQPDRAATMAVITAAAADLPLIYWATSDVGVIIVVTRTGELHAELLPDAGSAALQPLIVDYLAAQTDRAADPYRWERTLEATTRWIGRTLWPVVTRALPEISSADAETAFGVVPSGLIGLLPLQAVQVPDVSAPGRWRFVVDNTAIRVVPSAQLLRGCRTRGEGQAPGVPEATTLIVAVPERAGSVPLRHALSEAAAVRESVGAGLDLPGTQATREAVMAAMPGHSVLHFACHGRGDLADPRAAALLLAAEDELTAEDLLEQGRLDARLAVLSACQTATFGAALAEEMIGLPVALLQSGVAGVIGTLWEVSDVAAMLLVRRFFEEWRHRPEEPAQALRLAQAWIKDATNLTLHSWCPDVTELEPPADPQLRPLWASARPYAGLQYWASFSYQGW